MPHAPRPVRLDIVRPVDLRPSAHARGYDREWQRLATVVLADEPTCRQCRKGGRLTEAVLVDHVTPINDGGARLDRSNLQPLCRGCHAIKTVDDVRKRHGDGR